MRINANPSSVVQLKVTLIGTDPPVWRRVKVPADLNLRRLHDVIQVTMGWWDQHPHQFVIGNRRYGDPETSDGPTVHKDNLVKLKALLARGIDCFLYIYDFGADWRHEVVVERVLPPDPGVEYPIFIEGEGRGPPEDVGGVEGYQRFLAAVTNPDHPEHEDAQWWYGEPYDPADIEEEIIRVQLDRIAASRRGGIKGRGKPKPARRGR